MLALAHARGMTSLISQLVNVKRQVSRASPVAIGIKGLVVAISNSSLPGTQNGFPPLFARAKMFVMYTADRVIATLRTHEADLRPAGLCSLSLFGSVARETEADSDMILPRNLTRRPGSTSSNQLRWSDASPYYLAARWSFCPNR